MGSWRRRGGFSLIEVVIAIAIVAGGVTVILGLLPAMAQKASDSADTHTALRMAGGVMAQLKAEADGGFDTLVGSIPVMQANPDVGRQYGAEREGSDIRLVSTAPADANGQYFLIVVRKYGSGPLAYDGQGVLLNVNVVVSWPYRVPSASGLTHASTAVERRSVTYNLALNR